MRRGTRMDQAKRIEAKRLYWEGMRAVEVAAAVGCSANMVFKLMQVSPWPPRRRNPLRLSLSEREQISVGLESGESAIPWLERRRARREVGCSTKATEARELARTAQGGGGGTSAELVSPADRKASANRLSGQSSDARFARNNLPSALCAGTRHPAQAAD